MMKSKNIVKECIAEQSKRVSTDTIAPQATGCRIRAEDREFIRKMNEFTQEAGLLSDDPFYEVL